MIDAEDDQKIGLVTCWQPWFAIGGTPQHAGHMQREDLAVVLETICLDLGTQILRVLTCRGVVGWISRTFIKKM